MLVGIAAVFILLFGGGELLDVINKAVKSHVAQPERVKRAQETIAEMSKERVAAKHRITAIRTNIRALDKRHDATAEDYRAQLRLLDQEWRALQKKLLDGRFQLRDQLTEKEWNAVFVQVQKKS
jgi:predicted  nucleic acid-binding Zn-ribbon protein